MPLRTMDGQVTSNKADKTVTVSVERLIMHPVYKKYYKKSKKYLAHDEENTCGVGDTVVIQECAPMSKRKTWKVLETKKKAASIN